MTSACGSATGGRYCHSSERTSASDTSRLPPSHSSRKAASPSHSTARSAAQKSIPAAAGRPAPAGRLGAARAWTGKGTWSANAPARGVRTGRLRSRHRTIDTIAASAATTPAAWGAVERLAEHQPGQQHRHRDRARRAARPHPAAPPASPQKEEVAARIQAAVEEVAAAAHRGQQRMAQEQHQQEQGQGRHRARKRPGSRSRPGAGAVEQDKKAAKAQPGQQRQPQIARDAQWSPLLDSSQTAARATAKPPICSGVGSPSSVAPMRMGTIAATTAEMGATMPMWPPASAV